MDRFYQNCRFTSVDPGHATYNYTISNKLTDIKENTHKPFTQLFELSVECMLALLVATAFRRYFNSVDV